MKSATTLNESCSAVNTAGKAPALEDSETVRRGADRRTYYTRQQEAQERRVSRIMLHVHALSSRDEFREH